MSRSQNHKRWRIDTIVIWAFVVACFVYLFTVHAPWQAGLLLLAGVAVAIAFLVVMRWRGIDPAAERRKPHIVALGILIPPFDRIVREAETGQAVARRNEAVIDRMDLVLGTYDMCSTVPDGVTREFVDSGHFGLAHLTVRECAERVAAQLTEQDRELFLSRPEDDVADVLSFLFWDLLGDRTEETTSHWLKRRDAVAEPLASVLIRQLGDQAATVDEGQLATFLRSLDAFASELVREYVDDIPAGVVNRMLDIISSYAPVTDDDASCEWPTVDEPALRIAVRGRPSEAAEIADAAAHCAAQLPSGSRSAELFEFLYLRRFERDRAKAMWLAHSARLVRELAEVLSCGPQLPRDGESFRTYSANVECLVRIIEAQADYSLAHVQRVVGEIARHQDRAEALATYLDPNRPLAIDPVEMLDQIRNATGHGLPTYDAEISRLQEPSVVIQVLQWHARRVVRRAYPAVAVADLDRASLLAVGEFSVRASHCTDDTRHVVAVNAGSASVASMLLAVLVGRRYADVSPDPVIEIGEAATRPGSLDPKLVRQIGEDLAVGRWPTAVPSLERPDPGVDDETKPALEAISSDVVELRHEVGRIPDRTVARVHPLLNGTDGERPNEFDHLYLVTFDSEHGPLGALLDSLSSMSDPLRTRLRLMAASSPSDWPSGAPRPGCLDEVCRRVDGDYYTFGHYTRYARLGSLPVAASFDSFAATFFDDVRCLLRLTNGQPDFHRANGRTAIEWEGVEVNLLSLGRPIRYDLYQPGEPGLRDQSSLEGDDLQRRVGEAALEPMTSHRSPTSV
ncbi:hypothetical protein [Ilumatobacter sp.]|uniref:hypothetical protein n=1 Tax=Ilumatobacter sp. TaxID=1967498 RepID=UPI003AF8318C